MKGAEARGNVAGEAFSDASNQLVSADEPLAGLQRACGGTVPGVIAIPELLALVIKARQYGLRLSRKFEAVDGTRRVQAWVELEPLSGEQEGGCTIHVLGWQAQPLIDEEASAHRHHLEIDRMLAEMTARLDPAQNLITFDVQAHDLAKLEVALTDGLGCPWTDFVHLEGNLPSRPLHWRLLDGATCRIDGSQRTWRIQLQPLGVGDGSAGFALYLTPLEPLVEPEPDAGDELPPASLGHDLVPVLRAPITRIVNNAQTISRKLAGPVAEEYSSYAADIAVAGEHLLALIDDLTELEVVEASDFQPVISRIELGDISRRAAQVLGAEAREQAIMVVLPGDGERQWVLGDDRRTLQIILNLLSNAIRYSPRDSQVWLRLDREGSMGCITVADQGRGLAAEEQAAMFRKFERLGRTDSKGSGLGLYISHRIAAAMRGSLTVESAPGQGARLTLSLPLAD